MMLSLSLTTSAAHQMHTLPHKQEGRQTAASVMPLVAADATGAASFTWTVPAAQPTGDYTLKVWLEGWLVGWGR